MKSAFTQSMYSEGEHRLIFLETPDNQEVQVPKIETGGEASEDTINLQSTDQKNIEAVAANAQNSAQEKVDRFDADLKKTENTDGSTTVDLNLKLTIPGAAKIAELF